jgi:dienelactone hydrolase
MGTMIWLIAFVIEAGFAAYCILTKSNQSRVKSFIRMGALAAFVVLTLAAVIQWSFRWYGLAALLSIWAMLGALTLMRKKAEKNGYRTGSIVLKAIGTLLLVWLALTPALIFPQHRQPKVTGEHAVAIVNYTYTDKSRIETFTNTGENRKVNVEFWYPADLEPSQNGNEKYPLVVFSPGSFGTKTSNTTTFMELASNGYVVCSIDHPYHALFTIGADGHLVTMDPSFYREVVAVNNGKYDEATAFELEKKWMQLQSDDINFVLDTLLAQAQDNQAEAVYQLIDPEKIGLMGHSLGGESSAQVARERNDIGAVINLDADLGGEYVDYVNGKDVLNGTVYPVPILTILSYSMVRLISAIPDARDVVAVEHVSASAPNAYEVHIAGTDHQSLTDLPLVSPFLVSVATSSVKKAGGGETADKYYVIEKMNNLVLTFFNAYLKGEGSFSPAKSY